MRITRPTALLVATLLATGCAIEPLNNADTAPPATTPPATAPAATTVPAPTGTAGPFSPTDIAWLQLTVAMVERLLPVLDLVLARTTDPAWRHLAAQVGATLRTDLGKARRLLGDSLAPTTNPHEGHDMPGMVTAEELTALRSASGQPFLRLLAEHLRAHLTQSVLVASAERTNGVQPATTALAVAVVRDGTANLARLDRLAPPSKTAAPA
ncbi:DUF305 domain-containing protein [Micromonospora parathelypteridis]|uniref:Uncharacterized protein (DUF305 family) n=1 Tax=Micromonospora parathelypteridis TaxID=1839617 RepID=A0A840VTI9_9ACTN|nr:DUF305 domain-containing protein [Micromonospora parathelypteridis]MBB5475890.1 uncharacterized protein (DUF305 family) [Micromonospora parathelypteridis]GGO31921.1 hypothetical protein GCM10011576_61480 [Micromonospora parathelypteridis]